MIEIVCMKFMLFEASYKIIWNSIHNELNQYVFEYSLRININLFDCIFNLIWNTILHKYIYIINQGFSKMTLRNLVNFLRRLIY